MYISNLMSTAERWQAFARVVGWPGLARTVAKSALRTACFRASKTLPQQQRAAFENCRTLEDYFSFADHRFPPNQIKQEIFEFLTFAGGHQPQNVCEIGTRDGGTNFLLSQALSSVDLMIGVDLYVRNSAQLRFFSRPSQQITFINGSSCAAATIEKVTETLAGRKLDLLFIDGDHTYEGVKLDFLNFRHLVRENGIVAFHDIVVDHRTRYGTKSPGWAGDVPRFWSRIKSLYPAHEFVQDPEQDGAGIGAVLYSAEVPIPEDL